MKVIVVGTGKTLGNTYAREMAMSLALAARPALPDLTMELTIPPAEMDTEHFDFKKTRGKHNGRRAGAFGKRSK